MVLEKLLDRRRHLSRSATRERQTAIASEPRELRARDGDDRYAGAERLDDRLTSLRADGLAAAFGNHEQGGGAQYPLANLRRRVERRIGEVGSSDPKTLGPELHFDGGDLVELAAVPHQKEGEVVLAGTGSGAGPHDFERRGKRDPETLRNGLG
jgi:hypothetical protein